jgi:recombination endonuclease VII
MRVVPRGCDAEHAFESVGVTSANDRIYKGPRRRRQPSRGVENTWMRGALVAKPTCSVDGCDRESAIKGYCSAHYQRWRVKGDVGPAAIQRKPSKPPRPCHVDGCDRKHYSKGYCCAHYQRWSKDGNPGLVEVMEFSKADGPRVCSVSGCTRPYLASGYCSAHWQRWNRDGEPGAAEISAPSGLRCKVEGCHRSHYGQGYCSPHLRRWKRNGDPGAALILTKVEEICSVDGCYDTHSSRGYCPSHYSRWRRTGDPGPAFEVRRRDPSMRDDLGRKQCRSCDEWLPEGAYTKSRSNADGLSGECRECVHVAGMTKRYGVDPSWYSETLRKQNGGCAVCGTRPGQRKLHVDHAHSHCSDDKACPECVRGLLCTKCNTGIGMFDENPALFRLAIQYLKTHAGSP